MTVINSRSDIINKLVSDNNYQRYLEIGVRDNKNFNRINVDHKDGVDPAGKCNYKMTSDAFFQQLDESIRYDIVFIDGLHIKDQVLKDVNNSLKHLSENGVIVLHDCNPQKPEHATSKYKGYGTWNGTVWEAFAELRMTRDDLFMCTVNRDTGCGVVKRGSQKLFPRPNKVDYNFLANNRKKLLNLVSEDEFLNMKI